MTEPSAVPRTDPPSPRPGSVRQVADSAPRRSDVRGGQASLVARILIAATIVGAQLWGITVALDVWLLGHRDQARLMAAISVLGAIVCFVLIRFEPSKRVEARRRPRQQMTAPSVERASSSDTLAPRR